MIQRSRLKRKTGLKRTGLNPVSKQKARDNVKYRAAKELWREDRINEDGYNQCQFVGKPHIKMLFHDQSGRCIQTALDSPHHMNRRYGPTLYDRRYFMSVCPFHHSWIENNKREARKRGYILYT